MRRRLRQRVASAHHQREADRRGRRGRRQAGDREAADGATGVTYDGQPLYNYAGDGAPGQTAGEGLTDYGASWYALSAAGKAVVD